jgi:hypothetical protein
MNMNVACAPVREMEPAEPPLGEFEQIEQRLADLTPTLAAIKDLCATRLTSRVNAKIVINDALHELDIARAEFTCLRDEVDMNMNEAECAKESALMNLNDLYIVSDATRRELIKVIKLDVFEYCRARLPEPLQEKDWIVSIACGIAESLCGGNFGTIKDSYFDNLDKELDQLGDDPRLNEAKAPRPERCR